MELVERVDVLRSRDVVIETLRHTDSVSNRRIDKSRKFCAFAKATIARWGLSGPGPLPRRVPACLQNPERSPLIPLFGISGRGLATSPFSLFGN